MLTPDERFHLFVQAHPFFIGIKKPHLSMRLRKNRERRLARLLC
jgi:hypothetical protein